MNFSTGRPAIPDPTGDQGLAAYLAVKNRFRLYKARYRSGYSVDQEFPSVKRSSLLEWSSRLTGNLSWLDSHCAHGLPDGVRPSKTLHHRYGHYGFRCDYRRDGTTHVLRTTHCHSIGHKQPSLLVSQVRHSHKTALCDACITVSAYPLICSTGAVM